MTQRLTVASGVSLALHLSVLAIVGLLYARQHFDAIDTLPVLSLSLQTQAEGAASSKSESLEPLPEAEPRTPLPLASHDGGVTGDTDAERERLPAAERLSASEAPQTQSADARNEADADAGGRTTSEIVEQASESVEAAVVMTTGPGKSVPSQTRATLTGETVEIERRQRRMLDRRVERYMNNFERRSRSDPSLEWKHKGQRFRAEFEREPATTDTGLEHVRVRISTDDNGRKLSTEMTMRRLAFSNFGQFVNHWDPRVMIHDDIIDGRFHSNSDVTLSYSRQVRPVFNDKVTIAGHSIRISEAHGNVRRSEMFRAGLDTGVRSIGLPPRFDFADSDPDDASTYKFKRDTRLVFHPDGRFDWRSRVDSGTGKLDKRTNRFIAEGKTTLHVRGVVSGKVLVYSPRRIVIDDDIVYEDDPRFDPGSKDYLGLVSDGTVEIAEPEVTGPGGLEVHAAIYARRGFRVREFRRGNGDLLYLLGSLTVGSVDATEPRYRTRIEFDDRLETMRPPAFPVTDRYEVVAWDGRWQVEEGD
ncbi:MAG: hypothetical protein HKN49_14750 [Gammaproteobacteria bacterium]|nr:hypothetical protein [Gammaproteobacteria bacterium]